MELVSWISIIVLCVGIIVFVIAPFIMVYISAKIINKQIDKIMPLAKYASAIYDEAYCIKMFYTLSDKDKTTASSMMVLSHNTLEYLEYIVNIINNDPDYILKRYKKFFSMDILTKEMKQHKYYKHFKQLLHFMDIDIKIHGDNYINVHTSLTETIKQKMNDINTSMEDSNNEQSS